MRESEIEFPLGLTVLKPRKIDATTGEGVAGSTEIEVLNRNTSAIAYKKRAAHDLDKLIRNPRASEAYPVRLPVGVRGFPVDLLPKYPPRSGFMIGIDNGMLIRTERLLEGCPIKESARTLAIAGTHRYGMIAIASHSGPVQAAFLGSTTRKVVRASPFPVWVLHPRAPGRKGARLKLIRSTSKSQALPYTLTESDILTDLDKIPVSASKPG